MTRRSVLALLVLASLPLPACTRRSRVGSSMPPIEAESWLNLPPGGAAPPAAGFVVAAFFSPT
jgi:hypothetical protein